MKNRLNVNKKYLKLIGIVILLLALPLFLLILNRIQDYRSQAATPDNLESEAGVLSSSGVNKQTDSGASGGQFVRFDSSSGPTPTPIPNEAFPPITTLNYVPFPSVSEPSYLTPITDPIFGTKVVRVNSLEDQRHHYSSKPAWNADESLLLLNNPPGGSGPERAILNGSTYEVLQPTSGPPGDFTWSINDPNKGWGYALPNIMREVKIGADTEYRFQTVSSTILSQYEQISLGGGQGSGSNDDRYACIMFKKSNNDHGAAVFDNVQKKIISEVVLINSSETLRNYPNNCGMTQSGKYVHVGNSFDGTGVHQGSWIYDRSLSTETRRHITTNSRHWDAAMITSGQDVIVMNSQSSGGGGKGGYTVAYNLEPGKNTNLVAYWPNGHVSARNIKRPGWVYLSSFSTSGTFPGFGQVVAINLENPSEVQVFAHTHHTVNLGYRSETHASSSPTGTRIIFASEWGGSTMNAYVAGMNLDL